MFPHILAGRLWPTPTPLLRRSVIDAVGLFRNFSIFEDWDYECRAAALGVKLHHCREFLADKRDVRAQEGRPQAGFRSQSSGTTLGFTNCCLAMLGKVKLETWTSTGSRRGSSASQGMRGGGSRGRGETMRGVGDGRGATAGLDSHVHGRVADVWMARCWAGVANRRPAAWRAAARSFRACGVRFRSRSGSRSVAPGDAARTRCTTCRARMSCAATPAHHRQARRIFAREGNRAELAVGSVRDVGVRRVLPGAPANLFTLPDDYPALVARVSAGREDTLRAVGRLSVLSRTGLKAQCPNAPRTWRRSAPARSSPSSA